MTGDTFTYLKLYQFKEEEALKKSMKELKGTEIVPGRKIYFELQGPNGEAASKTDAAGEDRNGIQYSFVSHRHLFVLLNKLGRDQHCELYHQSY